MNFPWPPPFALQTLRDWITLTRPLSIFMTDKQYAHFCTLLGKNVKEFESIPICFLDAPQ